MILALPVDEETLEGSVCISFGRAPFFCYYNTETKTAEFIDNEAKNASGGAGITSSQNIVDKGTDVLLTVRCGQNAAEVLTGGNVKIYKTKFDTVIKNIEAFENGDLDLLGEIHPGFHGAK